MTNALFYYVIFPLFVTWLFEHYYIKWYRLEGNDSLVIWS